MVAIRDNRRCGARTSSVTASRHSSCSIRIRSLPTHAVMLVKVLYERTPAGGWVARVPQFPLVCATGHSLEAVRTRIREVLRVTRPRLALALELEEDYGGAFTIPAPDTICPICKQPGIDAEPDTAAKVTRHCPNCGHRWSRTDT